MHIPVVQVFFFFFFRRRENPRGNGCCLPPSCAPPLPLPHAQLLSVLLTDSFLLILIPGGFATKMTVKGKRNQEEGPGVVGREAPRLGGPESSFGEKLIGGREGAEQTKLWDESVRALRKRRFEGHFYLMHLNLGVCGLGKEEERMEGGNGENSLISNMKAQNKNVIFLGFPENRTCFRRRKRRKL